MSSRISLDEDKAFEVYTLYVENKINNPDNITPKQEDITLVADSVLETPKTPNTSLESCNSLKCNKTLRFLFDENTEYGPNSCEADKTNDSIISNSMLMLDILMATPKSVQTNNELDESPHGSAKSEISSHDDSNSNLMLEYLMATPKTPIDQNTYCNLVENFDIATNKSKKSFSPTTNRNYSESEELLYSYPTPDIYNEVSWNSKNNENDSGAEFEFSPITEPVTPRDMTPLPELKNCQEILSRECAKFFNISLSQEDSPKTPKTLGIFPILPSYRLGKLNHPMACHKNGY